MTFNIDTFTMAPTFGVRWEHTIAITETGCESLCDPIDKIIELDF